MVNQTKKTTVEGYQELLNQAADLTDEQLRLASNILMNHKISGDNNDRTIALAQVIATNFHSLVRRLP